MPMKKIHLTREMEEFLRQNVKGNSYKELTIKFIDEYNIKISEVAIRTKCLKLGIRKEYDRTFLTDEQVKFLKENYNQFRYKELAEMFNRRFNEQKKLTQIKIACRKYDLKKERISYTDEQIEFIKNTYKGITHEELTKRFNKKFNIKRTVIQIKNVCAVRNFLDNRDIRYTEEQIKWLRDNVNGKRWTEITALFNERFSKNKTKNQLMIYCSSIGIHSGIPFGQSNAEDGSVYIRSNKYSLIKVNGSWENKGRYEWKKHFGIIPKGKIIIFADGNCKNFSKDNLLAVTRAELITLNRKNMLFMDPELTKAGVLIAKLLLKIKERQKEVSNGGKAAD